MIVLYILLGIILLLVLLVSVPVVLRGVYDGEEFYLSLRYLFVSYSIYPREEKKPGKLKAYFGRVLEELKKKKKEKKKPSSAPVRKKESSWKRLCRERGIFGALGYMLRIVRQSAGLGAYIIRNSVISRMKVLVAVGGEDAAQIAMEQGEWCAALYPALSLVMSSVRRYKNVNVKVGADFLSEANRYDIDIRLRVKPFHGIVGAVRMFLYLIRAEVGEQQAAYSLDAIEAAKNNK